MIYLIWGNGLEMAETEEEAVQWIYWMIEGNESWVDKLEIIGEDGEIQIIDNWEELYSLAKPLRDKRDERNRKREERNPYIGKIMVDRSLLETFYGEGGREEAIETMEKLKPLLGNRVSWIEASPRQ